MCVDVFPCAGLRKTGTCVSEVSTFRLTHPSGSFFSVMEYGASITSIFVRDRLNFLGDVILGFSSLGDYLESGSCHGAVVGRSANRIRGAQYEWDGKTYVLPANDGPNNLHGGPGSFQNTYWEGKIISGEEASQFLVDAGIVNSFEIEGDAVIFHTDSPDGTCGFPGNLSADVLYAWTSDMTLVIGYRGTSDQDTIFAPTNHAYFNLLGHDTGNVGRHVLQINTHKMTNKGPDNVPDGTFSDTRDTIFDFETPHPLAPTMSSTDPQLLSSRGLDQNYCIGDDPFTVRSAAVLREPFSGRAMEVLTNFPGLQVYTGNHTQGTTGKKGNEYVPYAGVCLETQHYPDAIHHPSFPSPILRRGETKYYLTGYRFFVSS